MSEPVRAGDQLPGTFQRRPAPCPGCGAPSTEYSITGAAWRASRCEACVAADEAKAREDATREAVERHRLMVARNLLELAVPPLYASCDLATFQLHGTDEDRAAQGRVLQLATRYLGQWPDVPAVVTCAGKPGRGKGHVVWAIARGVVELGARARVVKLADAIRDLRDAWHRPDGESERERLQAYRSPDLLVVDEVSRHAFYGQPQQHLYDLVDYRLEHQRPTILTTNEDKAGLLDLLGPALMSRCASAGGYWEFGGPDYRLTGGRA